MQNALPFGLTGPDARLTWRAYAILACLALIFFLPGISTLPVTDRDEARFIEATRQMIDSGDYVNIRFQDEARNKKPVGIYWLQSVTVRAARLAGADADAVWPYRLVSTLSAVLVVLGTAALGVELFSAGPGWLGALLVASTLLLGVEGRIAKTDAAQAACIVWMMAGLARALFPKEGFRWRDFFLFWTALALGILIKGPIILCALGFTLLVLRWKNVDLKNLKRLRPAFGLPWLLLLILPWFVAITMASGGAFWHDSVGQDMLGKVAAAQERPFLPPGYYLLTFILTGWPLPFFLIVASPWIRKNWRRPGVLFLLAWAIPLWLMFEAVPTKLPHYTLPIFPALALLAAAALLAEDHAWNITRWPAKLGLALLWLTPLLLVGLLQGGLWRVEGQVSLAALVVSLLGLKVLTGARTWLARDYGRSAAMAGVVASLLILVPAFALVMPRFAYIWPTAGVVKAVEAHAAGCEGIAMATLGYNEPSMVFAFGAHTALDRTPEEALAILKEGSCRFVVADARKVTADFEEIAPVAAVDGFNLGGGKPVHLLIYQGTLSP